MSAADLVKAAKQLARDVDGLRFPSAAYIYNPLDYAWPLHRQFIEKYGEGKKRVLLVGMNPGPWGMAQTGVPFGEVSLVSSWLKLDAKIGRPKREHPKRPVLGLATGRHEVSGARLWGAIARRHPSPATFFESRFIVNYCPLMFLVDSGANMTPDKLTAKEREPLLAACRKHLERVVSLTEPSVVIGVGTWALARAREVVDDRVRCVQLPHPSPASPAANRDWAGQARQALVDVDDELL